MRFHLPVKCSPRWSRITHWWQWNLRVLNRVCVRLFECAGESCKANEFNCTAGTQSKCINISWVCDGYLDCENGEDEAVSIQTFRVLGPSLFENENNWIFHKLAACSDSPRQLSLTLNTKKRRRALWALLRLDSTQLNLTQLARWVESRRKNVRSARSELSRIACYEHSHACLYA